MIRMEALEQEALRHWHAAQQERTSKAALDPGRAATTFQVGDLVTAMLRTKEPLDAAAAAVGELRPRRDSPFPVATLAGPNTHTLALPRRFKCSPAVNVDRLKPCPAPPPGPIRPVRPGFGPGAGRRVRRGAAALPQPTHVPSGPRVRGLTYYLRLVARPARRTTETERGGSKPRPRRTTRGRPRSPRTRAACQGISRTARSASRRMGRRRGGAARKPALRAQRRLAAGPGPPPPGGPAVAAPPAPASPLKLRAGPEGCQWPGRGGGCGLRDAVGVAAAAESPAGTGLRATRHHDPLP